MVLDRLDNAARYARLHPGLDAAFAFLQRADLAELPPGRHEIASGWLYAMIIQGEGKGTEGAKMEVHRQWVDLQFVLSGGDVIGWRATAECAQPEGDFDEEKDCGMFGDAPAAWIAVPPGAYAILFPEDAHAPMAGGGPVHKVVVKVAV